jgi:hypothetical protein
MFAVTLSVVVAAHVGEACRSCGWDVSETPARAAIQSVNAATTRR